VYALGATMYALLTGTIPVAAHERVAGREVVRPSAIVPAIPPALEDVVLRALDLNVNLRPQSIAELRRLLDALTPGPPTGLVTEESGGRTVRLGGGPGTAAAGTHQSRRRLVGGAVAGAVLLATAGVGIWALRGREPAGEAPAPVEAGGGPGSPPSVAAPPPPSVTATEPGQPPVPAPPVDAPKASERPAVEPAPAPARSGAGTPSAARKPGAATRAFEQARSRTETEATPPPPPRPRAAAPAVKATRAQPAAPPRRQPLPSAAWERKARGGQP
jgi:serine/threonine-protein kinase